MATRREWTGDQAFQVLKLIRDKKTPREQVQALLTSGILSDVLDARVECVDRVELLKILGLVSVDFLIWRTLTIGGVTKDDLLRKLADSGCFVSDWAENIMSKPQFTTLSRATTLNLVRLAVRDLGFTKDPTTHELFTRAQECGLALCPAEVGPHLRLALDNQPRNDYFWVAMDPITDSHGNPLVFHVLRDDVGKRLLSGDCAGPEDRCRLVAWFVFVLRT